MTTPDTDPKRPHTEQTEIDPAALADEDDIVVDTRDVHLRPEFVREVVAAGRAGEAERARTMVQSLHAADLADLFEVVPSNDRRILAGILEETLDPELLTELEGAAQDDVLDTIANEKIADAVTRLESDDAVSVIEELDARDQQEVLGALAADERRALEESLAYPEDSAGRLMQRDLIAVPEFWNVGQTIDFMRAEPEALPTDFYDIIVVDPTHTPVGTVPLSRVMRSKRPVEIKAVMEDEPRLIRVDEDLEDVAYEFRKYHLISAPVVDGDGRLVGVITADDIAHVIEEEAEEDILALAGVTETDINESTVAVARTRFVWLLVNLGTAVLASVVIGLFDATIEQMVALAVLMPIVASMGGNAGTQTMTVAVRAIATRELTPTNAFRLVNKEVLVSLLNGILLAAIVGVLATLWFGSAPLGLVLAAAMIINLISAGLSGILIPMGLDKLGIDPAVASTVFVTTITDVVGFFAFLGLAALLLL